MSSKINSKKFKGMEAESNLVLNKTPINDGVSPETRFSLLKRNGMLIYDSFLSHNLSWGSLSVAWGPVIEPKDRLMDAFSPLFDTEQTLYFAGRTDGQFDEETQSWTGSPGEFFVSHVVISKLRTQSRHSFASFRESRNSKRVGILKRLIHPGEVNRIRSLPDAQHMIATLSDSPHVYVWNTLTQPHREENQSDSNSIPLGGRSKATKPGSGGSSAKNSGTFTQSCQSSRPDFKLVGHEKSAEFALDTKGSTKILSAGRENALLLWDLSGTPDLDACLQPCQSLLGHNNLVEDCSFKMLDKDEDMCCSVGRDRSLCLWDLRASNQGPTTKLDRIHSNEDVNCCAWSQDDLIITGGGDANVNVYDIRKLVQEPLLKVLHKGPVINVRWSPHEPGVFSTSDEAEFLSIFRLSNRAEAVECLLQHQAHRSTVVDFQFNPHDPWVFASVSDDSSENSKRGGGIFQCWRLNELIYKDIERDPLWAEEMSRVLKEVNKSTAASSEDDEVVPEE